MKNLLLITGLLYSVGVFSQIPNYVPPNGLAGYWPFTGNTNDQSTNSNNGTASGAALIQDRFGTANAAYNFNGTSDYISVPDNASLSGFNDMTISVWVNMNQFSGIQAIVSKWFYVLNCGSNSDTYAFSLQNNTLVSATNNNNTTGLTSTQVFTTGDLNVWKHFVFISNSVLGQHSIYINGVLAGTGPVAGTICNSTNALIFGAAIPTFRYFKGSLDDIGIWNRVLSDCEISQLYTASMPGAGSPCATTGIQDIDRTNKINIYPNPSSDQFNVDLASISENDLSVTLTDITGKVVLNQSVDTNLTPVKLNSVANGIYIVTINNNKGVTLKREKLVVSK